MKRKKLQITAVRNSASFIKNPTDKYRHKIGKGAATALSFNDKVR